jgi:hypothetical protein
MLFPPGHHHSPIPSFDDMAMIDSVDPSIVPCGIELHALDQFELLKQLSTHYHDCSFPHDKTAGYRYYYQNGFFSYSDAVLLHCLIGYFRPQRAVEIGCGFSSAALLDINERIAGGRIQCTFVDPDSDRLFSLLKPGDLQKHSFVTRPVQELPVSTFQNLAPNDILFVDSSHVLKTGSDVNFILFEILPRLNKGVLIHFQDVFYPFEYPKEWAVEGRAWNELYAVRAFLSFNTAFQILLFNTYLTYVHRRWFAENMPLCLRNTGSSFWIRKTEPPDRCVTEHP